MTSASAKLPLALPGNRVGLLGGSFNPAHAGHLHVSLWSLKRLALDRVWWMVTPGNPLKSHAELADYDKRIEDARRLAPPSRIDVTDFEGRLGFIFTVETAAYLRTRYPETRFVFLMGADSFAELHRWRAWRRLMGLMPIAVIDRPGWRLKALASPAAHYFARARLDESDAGLLANLEPPVWSFLTIPLSPLSSTAIRATHQAIGGAKRT